MRSGLRARTGVLTAIGAAAIGAGVVAGLVKPAAEVEQQLNVLQATAGATGEQMKALSDLARTLGADLTLPATSSKDAAEAMTELAKGGLAVNDILTASKGVLQLSAAGQLGNAQAAQITANALNAFGLAGTQATHVADLLAAASKAATGEVSDMADAMQMSAAVFAGANVPIEDLTTEISLLAKAGILGSDAGTSLKQMMLQLGQANGIPKTKALMDALGFSVFDAAGKWKSQRDIIAELVRTIAPLNDADKALALTTIFGSDATRVANVLLREGVAGFDAMKDAVTEQGAAADLAAARNKGLTGAIDGFKSSVQTLAIDLGTKLLPRLTEFTRRLSEMVNGANELGPALQGIGAGAQVAWGMVKDLFQAIKDNQATAFAGVAGILALGGAIVLSLGPVSAAMLAIVGIGVALVAFNTDWNRVFTALPPPVKIAFANVLDATAEWAAVMAAEVGTVAITFNALADTILGLGAAELTVASGMAAAAGHIKLAADLWEKATRVRDAWNPIPVTSPDDVRAMFKSQAHLLREQGESEMRAAAVAAFETAAKAASTAVANSATEVARKAVSAAAAEFEAATAAAVAATAGGGDLDSATASRVEAARQAVAAATAAFESATKAAVTGVEAARMAVVVVMRELEAATKAAAAVADSDEADPAVVARLEAARAAVAAASSAFDAASKAAAGAGKSAGAVGGAVAGAGKSLAELMGSADAAGDAVKTLADRLKAARESIEASQTSDVVKAFFDAMIKGTDPDAAIARARSVISQQDTVWAQLIGTLHNKLGIEVPDEFRAMWEQMTEATKQGGRDTLTTWRDELKQRLASVGRLLPAGLSGPRSGDNITYNITVPVNVDPTGRVNAKELTEAIVGATVEARTRAAAAAVR